MKQRHMNNIMRRDPELCLGINAKKYFLRDKGQKFVKMSAFNIK